MVIDSDVKLHQVCADADVYADVCCVRLAHLSVRGALLLQQALQDGHQVPVHW
jgi:hypothetical protein